MEEEIKNEIPVSQATEETTTAQQQEQQPAPQQQGVNIKINRGLKIANIILLCILLASEAYALYFYIPSIQLLFANDLSALGILAVLPLYMLITLGIIAISIAMTIISACWKKYLVRMQQLPNFFDKLMGFIGWIIVIINVLGFIALYLI